MARLATVIVEGRSMAPTYRSGDWLLALWKNFASAPKIGAILVIERDEQPGILYVKRLTEINSAGELYLSSDNEAGTDSRQWGWLPLTSVKARVLFRVKRAQP